MPLPPPPPLVGVEACYTNADSSPTTLLQIEGRKKSGTKIHHGLKWPPNKNKMQQPTKNTWAQQGRDET
jgi:hypothetical protein